MTVQCSLEKNVYKQLHWNCQRWYTRIDFERDFSTFWSWSLIDQARFFSPKPANRYVPFVEEKRTLSYGNGLTNKMSKDQKNIGLQDDVGINRHEKFINGVGNLTALYTRLRLSVVRASLRPAISAKSFQHTNQTRVPMCAISQSPQTLPAVGQLNVNQQVRLLPTLFPSTEN